MLFEIFLIFFRLGATAFGGPIALIATMEQELCHKRKWFSVDEFTQVFAICKLMPGPVAIQTAIYLLYTKHGRMAGFLAGFGMTLPASVMMLCLSFLYSHYGNTYTQLAPISNFMQNAALAIIIIVTFDLGKLYIKNTSSSLIMFISGISIFLFPTWEPIIIITFGIFGLIKTFKFNPLRNVPVIAAVNPSIWQIIYPILTTSKLPTLFWVCFKTSAFIFGTGLAIIPLLQGELVQHLHWLTNKQFIDGITLGQITPGPVTTSVVFFGYTAAGFSGAIIACLGFYIPPLFNTLVILPIFWQKIITSRYLQTFSLWAFPAIIGGLASASVKIGIETVNNYYGVATLIVAIIIVYKKLFPLWLLIPSAGIIGMLLTMM